MAEEEALLEDNIDESFEDLGTMEEWASGAVLWSTDWTTETILNQLTKQNIDLDPSFQRRSAWTDKKQSLFIESLALGLPIPQLILAESLDKRGAFLVIDGKQRLLAIRRFGSTENTSGFRPLKLSGLKKVDCLNGKTYESLQREEDLSGYRTAFENSSIRTVVIRNWQREEYLYEVFLRINTGSVQLSPQELRQALHPGPFSKFVGEASAESIELQQALNLKAPDFRMRDAEILLRYLAYRNYIRDYKGNLKNFLDETTRKLNAKWDSVNINISSQVTEMNQALKFTEEVFSQKKYLRKWNGNEFETRKNRAIFDIMLHYFSRSDVRNALIGKKEEIVSAFKELCNDDDFRSSLETTTKTPEANRIRFNRWGDRLSIICGIDLKDMQFPE